jgi:hypothetical protein
MSRYSLSVANININVSYLSMDIVSPKIFFLSFHLQAEINFKHCRRRSRIVILPWKQYGHLHSLETHCIPRFANFCYDSRPFDMYKGSIVGFDRQFCSLGETSISNSGTGSPGLLGIYIKFKRPGAIFDARLSSNPKSDQRESLGVLVGSRDLRGSLNPTRRRDTDDGIFDITESS